MKLVRLLFVFGELLFDISNILLIDFIVSCVVFEHKTHKYVSLVDAFDRFNDLSTKQTSEAVKMIDNLERTIESGNETMNRLSMSLQTISDQIDSEIELLIIRLREKQTNLKNQLKFISNNHLSTITQQNDKCQTMIDNLKEKQIQINETLNNSPNNNQTDYDCQHIIAFNQMEIQINSAKQIEKQINRAIQNKGDQIEIQIDENLSNSILSFCSIIDCSLNCAHAPNCKVEGKGIKGPIVSCGVVCDFHLFTFDFDGNQLNKGGCDVCVIIKSLESNEQIEVNIKDTNDGHYRISYTPIQSGLLEIYITIDGWPINQSPFNVTAKSGRANYSILDESHIRLVSVPANPNDLAFMSNGHWVINDDSKRLLIVSNDGHLIRTIEDSRLGRISGLTVSQSNSNIFVINAHKSIVVILNSNGDLIGEFGGRGIDVGRLFNPESIILDYHDNLLIADSGNDRIQLFEMDGTFRETFGSTGKLPGCFREPTSIAINSRGHLIVADTRNRRIQVFTSDGRFQLAIGGGSQHHQTNLTGIDLKQQQEEEESSSSSDSEYDEDYSEPINGKFGSDFICVAVDKFDRIIVGDLTYNCIQFFEPDGDFISLCHIPSIDLTSIAIDDDGHVCICDSHSKRIAILNPPLI